MLDQTSLLIIGFILTGILGGFWGYLLKRRSWTEETRHSLYLARYNEGTVFLDELSELIGRRFYLLQQLWWAIEGQNTEKIEKRMAVYFVAVEDWNAHFWQNRNKIRLLVGEDYANLFLDYSDDNAEGRAHSLHYNFVIVHRKVMVAKADLSLSDDARRHVIELNWQCSVFLERLTTTFIERAKALQLLEMPAGPGAAERASVEYQPSIKNPK